jgi:hypothetical protein
MRFFLLIFTMDINSALPYSKLLAFAFLLEIVEIFFCLLLVLHVKLSPSARCASVANTVCKDTEIFSKHLVTLKHILKQLFCVKPFVHTFP